jgi:AcrR family transcriptional regulator
MSAQARPDLAAEGARAYRREPDEKRERILAAAREVFGAKGFRGATTAEIATHAGVSEGILFHHFGSKRGLFATVAAAFGRGLAEAMFGEEPGTELVSAADAIRRAFDYVRENRSLHRLFLVRDPQLDELVHGGPREEIVGALEAVFRRGAERGVLRPMDTRIVAELMYALVSGALEACFVSGDGTREEDYLREAVQSVAGAMLPLTPDRTPSTGGAEEDQP